MNINQDCVEAQALLVSVMNDVTEIVVTIVVAGLDVRERENLKILRTFLEIDCLWRILVAPDTETVYSKRQQAMSVIASQLNSTLLPALASKSKSISTPMCTGLYTASYFPPYYMWHTQKNLISRIKRTCP